MTREEEVALFNKLRHSKGHARLEVSNDIAERNMGLLKHVVAQWGERYPNIDYHLIFSEANLCLFECVSGFDERQGNKFSTYLTIAMNNRIMRALGKLRREGPSVPLEYIAPELVTSAPKDETQWLGPIKQAILDNKASLPPRDIRLLRAIYTNKEPMTIADMSLRCGLTEQELSKKIRALLRKLQKGM